MECHIHVCPPQQVKNRGKCYGKTWALGAWYETGRTWFLSLWGTDGRACSQNMWCCRVFIWCEGWNKGCERRTSRGYLCNLTQGSYTLCLHGHIEILHLWHRSATWYFFFCTFSSRRNEDVHSIWQPSSLQHSHFTQVYCIWGTLSILAGALTTGGTPEVYRTESWLHKFQWQKLPLEVFTV